MADPYKVLGISRDASTDEIKKAYRTLSRKYHPDANINNPNKAQAEEMFKLVQQAYKQIMDEKEGRASSSGSSGQDYGGYGGYGGFGGFGGYGQGNRQQNPYGNSEADVEMRAAANFINNRMYSEAMNVLNNISGHTAYWYYLHAVANYGLGNNINAVQDAQQAVNMEPDNFQYRQLLQQLQGGGQWYTSMGQDYGFDREGSGFGNWCCQCLACNAILNCCCC
ncbi:MAG TPA: J domain-containing protein [Candidatus Pelethocola excrementipullorum]|nr:J domain-containing protein [Candidatus Pelethocola excrementipullorum]